MRVRDHVAISTAAAVLSRRWLGRNAMALWAGAVLIDSDHYLAFCLQEGRVSPAAAVRFYGGPAASEHWATRAFHAPLAVLAVLGLGARLRPLTALGFGMSLHVMLDAGHEARMGHTRAAALERDRHTCQSCGARATPHVGTHLARQPWLLPSYRPRNVVSLCGPCHELAHARQASTL
jgi:hypothetical protein